MKMILLHVRRLREASFLNEYLIVVIVRVKNLHSRLCLTPPLHMMIVTLNTNNFCSWSQSLITQVGWWCGGVVWGGGDTLLPSNIAARQGNP